MNRPALWWRLFDVTQALAGWCFARFLASGGTDPAGALLDLEPLGHVDPPPGFAKGVNARIDDSRIRRNGDGYDS